MWLLENSAQYRYDFGMISIVVPCYNEEKRFRPNYWRKLLDLVPDLRLIFVNDGSVDNTFASLRNLTHDRASILNLSENSGKGEAVRLGILHALTSELFEEVSMVGFLDADCAFDIQDVQSMIEDSQELFKSSEAFHTTIGSRVKLAGRDIQRTNLRHYSGRVITTFVCRGWNDSPYDTQSGFKIFRVDDHLRFVIAQPFMTKWFFDIEIILRLSKISAAKTFEFTLSRWVEMSGGSIQIQSAIDIIRQIIIIRSLVKKYLKSEGIIWT